MYAHPFAHVYMLVCPCKRMPWYGCGQGQRTMYGSGSLLPPRRSQGLTQYIRLGSRHLCPVNDLTDS